jgi:ABC-type branched-subunit amino acid transport system ATPase component
MTDGHEPPALQVQNVSVTFGGNVALRDVSLTARTGRVTGLIGPNGAGKTTAFDVCSGFTVPVEGRVFFFGRDLTGVPPARRARLGLGRTFQRMELFDSLTVAENIALGREARFGAGSPWRHVVARGRERHEIADAVDDAICLCGLSPLSTTRAGTLSTGQRRLVELARAVAGGFRFLLLDEPSSGLDQSETAALGRIVRSLADERGIGVLLVEHDMSLVMGICDDLHVLDFGQVIFSGGPSEAKRSERVRAAYLGASAADEVTV